MITKSSSRSRKVSSFFLNFGENEVLFDESVVSK